MAKRNNALESMKKWMEFIPQCLQPQGKQIDNEEPKEKPAARSGGRESERRKKRNLPQNRW